MKKFGRAWSWDLCTCVHTHTQRSPQSAVPDEPQSLRVISEANCVFRIDLISEAAQREPQPRRGIVMFGIVDKAHDSRKTLVLVWKRLKQNSKPEYLPTLTLFEPFQVLFRISFNVPEFTCFLPSKATMAGQSSQLFKRTLPA